MPDKLPNIEGDRGQTVQSIPVTAFDTEGNPTAQPTGNFFALGASDVSADQYCIAVDLSDTTAYPHNSTEGLMFNAVYLTVDKENDTQGILQLGIITRIDETDCDIEFIQGVNFSKSGETSIVRDRAFGGNWIDGTVSDGDLPNVASEFKAQAITAVNTSATLPDALGNAVTPALGDAVVFMGYTSGGAYNASISGFYAGKG